MLRTKRPRRVPCQERSKDTLACVFAGVDRLATQGRLAPITMREVARTAGVGTATLYQYFASCDDVLVAWEARRLERVAEGLTRLLDAELNAGTTWERTIARTVDAWLDAVEAHFARDPGAAARADAFGNAHRLGVQEALHRVLLAAALRGEAPERLRSLELGPLVRVAATAMANLALDPTYLGLAVEARFAHRRELVRMIQIYALRAPNPSEVYAGA